MDLILNIYVYWKADSLANGRYVCQPVTIFNSELLVTSVPRSCQLLGNMYGSAFAHQLVLAQEGRLVQFCLPIDLFRDDYTARIIL